MDLWFVFIITISSPENIPGHVTFTPFCATWRTLSLNTLFISKTKILYLHLRGYLKRVQYIHFKLAEKTRDKNSVCQGEFNAGEVKRIIIFELRELKGRVYNITGNKFLMSLQILRKKNQYLQLRGLEI